MDNYRNHLILKKVLVQGYPLSSILFNLFINDILNKCDKYVIAIDDKRYCGGLITE